MTKTEEQYKKDIHYYVEKLEKFCLALFEESEKKGNPEAATEAILGFSRGVMWQSFKANLEIAQANVEKAGSTEH